METELKHRNEEGLEADTTAARFAVVNRLAADKNLEVQLGRVENMIVFGKCFNS